MAVAQEATVMEFWKPSPPKGKRVFGKTTKIIELAKMILEILNLSGKTVVSTTGISWKGDISTIWFDISKAKRELRWTPKITLEEHLKKLIGEHPDVFLYFTSGPSKGFRQFDTESRPMDRIGKRESVGHGRTAEVRPEDMERLGMDPKALAFSPGGGNQVQNPEALLPICADGGSLGINQREPS
jgi:hypothetical protein